MSRLPEGKSAALAWLAPRLVSASVPPFIRIPVVAWRSRRDPCMRDVRALCADGLLAVRSDAFIEDRLNGSLAGHFLSGLGVEVCDLPCAIDAVSASLPGHPDDAILVQRMASDVVLGGVAS